MRFEVVIAFGVALVGCDAVFGLDGRKPIDAGQPDAPPDASPCGAGSLNTAGCACETVGAVQNCYLGDPGPNSQCRINGTVTCGDSRVWGPCTGAAAPAQEVCFDGIDNDCEGIVDDGCRCTNGDNLCLDPTTGQPFTIDKLWPIPAQVKRVENLSVLAVSPTPITLPAFQTASGMCTGSSVPCTLGGACAGWFGVEFGGLNGSTAWFTSTGMQTITVYRNSGGNPPCNPVMEPGKITGTINVLQ